MITTAAFTAVMVGAGIFDLKWRRIPNYLTVGAVVLGLVLRAPIGPAALVSGLWGVGLGLLLSVPFFMIGALGGGDAKLLAAVGAFLGPKDMIGACLLIGVLGGVLALVEAVRRGALRALLLNVFYIMSRWMSPDRRSLQPTLTPPARMTIPYGVPIAVGALAWWFWGGNVV
ncbi:MAG: A24 family peptidase [Gemmatimonadales bacterium]